MNKKLGLILRLEYYKKVSKDTRAARLERLRDYVTFFTCKIVPFLLQFDMENKTSFHDVDAVVATRFQSSIALTRGTGIHFLYGF